MGIFLSGAGDSKLLPRRRQKPALMIFQQKNQKGESLLTSKQNRHILGSFVVEVGDSKFIFEEQLNF